MSKTLTDEVEFYWAAYQADLRAEAAAESPQAETAYDAVSDEAKAIIREEAEAAYRVDSNSNEIRAVVSGRTRDGLPLVVVRLTANLGRGYIAQDEGTGGFGTAECPSSYGMPCMSWFGEGERYPDAETALAAIAN